MAHGLIASADFEAIADHIAYVWENKRTVQASGLPMFTQLSAADNADLTAAGVEDAFRRLDQVLYDAEWYNSLFFDALNALTRHFAAAAVTDTAKDSYADLDAYLVGEGIRVHKAIAEIYALYTGGVSALTPAQVFDRSAITLGTINWTGAGTGTLTDGSALSSLTGGNSLQWRIPTDKTVTSSVVVLTVKLPDGTNTTEEVTIDGEAGDTGDVGTHFDDIYTDLVSIAISSGGANGEQAIIESVCDRDPALIS